MTDDFQPALFDVAVQAPTVAERAAAEPSIHPPAGAWFKAGKTAPFRHAERVMRGQHPLGRPLSAWPGATCGNCTHAVAAGWRGERTYHKCILDRSRWTASPGSDLRLRWRACAGWAPGVTKVFVTAQEDEISTPTDARLGKLPNAWWPAPGLPDDVPMAACTVLGVDAYSGETHPEWGAWLAFCEIEGLSPSCDHTRVALAHLVAVVKEGMMGLEPAARLLLKAVKEAVAHEQARSQP